MHFAVAPVVNTTKTKTSPLSTSSISADLTWSSNTKILILNKALLRPHFLRPLRRTNINQELLRTFYRSAIESIPPHCIPVWFPLPPLPCQHGRRTAESLKSGEVSRENYRPPPPQHHRILHPSAARQQTLLVHQDQYHVTEKNTYKTSHLMTHTLPSSGIGLLFIFGYLFFFFIFVSIYMLHLGTGITFHL